MIHRLDMAALPELGSPAPVHAPMRGASERALGPRGLCFRGPGGVYAPGRGGAPELRFPDDARGRACAPAPFSGGIALRWGPNVVFVLDDGARLAVPGDTFALAPEAPVAVVLERTTRRLRRVDLDTEETQVVTRLRGGLERQVSPALSVDPAGHHALVMDTDASGRVHLLRVDLRSGATQPVHGPLPPRSWVVGAFGPRGDLVVLEQRFGPPRARLLHLLATPTVLVELGLPQPMLRPRFLRPDLVVVVLSLEPAGLASYGPRDLFAVAIPGGARRQLSRVGDLVGPPHRVSGRLFVDGTHAMWSWDLPRS